MRLRAVTFATTVAVLGISSVGVAAPTFAVSQGGNTPAVTSSNLYVDQAHCPTTGADGSQAKPFCTITAGAAAAEPGDTVIIAPSTTAYNENVVIANSGTPAAPITFQVGDGSIPRSITITGGTSTDSTPLVTVSNAHNVVIKGFDIRAQLGDVNRPPSLKLDSSSRITVQDGDIFSEVQDSLPVEVTGGSSDNTITREYLLNGFNATTVTLDPGATNTVFTDDDIATRDSAALAGTDAPGTVVASSTIDAPCHEGITLSGTSTGAAIVNNVIQTENPLLHAPSCAGDIHGNDAVAITVAATATSGTTVDGNLIDPSSQAPLYRWAGTDESNVADFTTDSGQGQHDLAGPTNLTNTYWGSGHTGDVTNWGTAASPNLAIDSAIPSPYLPDTDISLNPRADDPDVTNGTAGYADRGANEDLGTAGLTSETATRVAGGGPFDVTATGGYASPWTTSGPVGQTTFNFGDGTTPTTTHQTHATHTYLRAGTYTVTIGENYGGRNGQTHYATEYVQVGANYVPVAPTRVLDTRNHTGVPTTTPIAAGATLTLPLPTIAGLPAAQISSIALNVTETAATAAGHLDVNYDAGRPTSTLNFVKGQTVANLTLADIGTGHLTFHNGSSGSIHVLADLEGYYAAAGNGFAPEPTPKRVLDTRVATGVTTRTPVRAAGTVKLDVSKALPAGATAAQLNLTETASTRTGYITAYPDGATKPTASALNYRPGYTTANALIVPVTNGKIDLYNASSGTVHLIADLTGYFGTNASGATQTYLPLTPTRVLDTRTTVRSDPNLQPFGPIGAGKSDAVFQEPCCYATVVYNITATQPKASGYFTTWFDTGAWPPHTIPTASTLNFAGGQTVANYATIADPTSGLELIYNASKGTTHAIADKEGAYLNAPTP